MKNKNIVVVMWIFVIVASSMSLGLRVSDGIDNGMNSWNNLDWFSVLMNIILVIMSTIQILKIVNFKSK